MSNLDKILVDEKELAPLIGLSVSFLQKDRRGRRIVPFVQVAGRARYNIENVKAALLALEQGGDATRRQAARGAA
jgi:hypothetical protein